MPKESSISLKIPGIQKVRTRPRSERTMVFPSVPEYRRNSYPSKKTEVSPTSTARRGVMDNLHLESQEVADEIRKKSKNVAVPFNKGAYQYISDGDDVKFIGRK